MFSEARGAAKVLGVEFLSVEVKGPNPDIEGAFRTMIKDRLGAFVTEAPPLISLNRKKILQLAAQYRMPTIYTDQEWAERRWSHVLRSEPSRLYQACGSCM